MCIRDSILNSEDIYGLHKLHEPHILLTTFQGILYFTVKSHCYNKTLTVVLVILPFATDKEHLTTRKFLLMVVLISWATSYLTVNILAVTYFKFVIRICFLAIVLWLIFSTFYSCFSQLFAFILEKWTFSSYDHQLDLWPWLLNLT